MPRLSLVKRILLSEHDLGQKPKKRLFNIKAPLEILICYLNAPQRCVHKQTRTRLFMQFVYRSCCVSVLLKSYRSNIIQKSSSQKGLFSFELTQNRKQLNMAPKRKSERVSSADAKKQKKSHRFDLSWSTHGDAGARAPYIAPVLLLTSDTVDFRRKVAGFDIDSTLIATQSGRKFATGQL